MAKRISTAAGTLILIAIAVVVLLIPGNDTQEQGSQVIAGDSLPNSIHSVAAVLGRNDLRVEANDLRELPNPRGEGMFVYVPRTHFSGVTRYIIWLVIDETVYPLNGATKTLTPELPWPREAPPGIWQRTGLDPYTASEAIQIVFDAR